MTEAQTERFTLQEYFTPTDRRRLRRFPHLVRISFAIVWQAAKRELLECILIQAATAAGLATQLLLVRSLLSHLVGVRSTSFSSVLPQLIAVSVITLMVGTAGAVLSLRSRLLAQLVALHAIDGVIRTATGVDLITYDSPGFHDRLQRAQLAAATRPAAMVQELIGAAGSILSIGGIAFALLLIQPLFCLLVMVAYVPIWFTTNRAGRLGYRQTVEQTERERMRQYLFEVLTTKQPAQEMRAFEVGGFLADRQRAIYRQLLDELRVVLRRRMRIALVGQALTALLSAGALAVLVWFVTSGRMSLSAAGSAAGAMVLLSGRLHGLAGGTAGLYENSLYLEDYASFVAAAPRIEAQRPTRPVQDDPQVMVAHDVSFTYPSRTKASLLDASLVLRRGEVVALVGENGSGKTTFAKVLAGLYAPSSGRVTWDDVDIATLDPGAVRRRVAVIFQDFVRYLLAAEDNIALGDHERYGDAEAVQRAAQAAGIHDTLAGLPRGYETILGPAYYGGSDLSGGQWQRIALARLFFRDAPLVILDEPTASLDPRAEAELYESMRTLFAGRGVLLISHRFGSVRTADRIYVLRDGRIHEEGTHQQLIAAGGYYAELFEMQAGLYRD
jgi:ATP-binding cassette subfamily B protein